MKAISSKPIDHVQQAFSISQEHKEVALKLYKEAVSELVHKNYIPQHYDAHTDLSGIFGVKWVIKYCTSGDFWNNPGLYAEANTAFNYANLRHSNVKKFIELSKNLVIEEERVSEGKLLQIAQQMNSILTATTVDAICDQLHYSN
jgi:hypothetical protein